jgi:prefoldin subunit 2
MADTIESINANHIMAQFEEMKQSYGVVCNKLAELQSDVNEHELVIATLKDMSDDRKCFRLVGEVLVERNVGQVLPALEEHCKGIAAVIERLEAEKEKRAQAINAFAAKYNIRPRGAADEERQRQQQQQQQQEAASKDDKSSAANEGILV